MRRVVSSLFLMAALASCGSAKGAASQKGLVSIKGDYLSEILPSSLQNALGIEKIKARISATGGDGLLMAYHPGGTNPSNEHPRVFFFADQFTSASYEPLVDETGFLRLDERLFLAVYSFIVPYDYVPNPEKGNREFTLKLRLIQDESEVVYFSSYQAVYDTSGPFEVLVFHYVS